MTAASEEVSDADLLRVKERFGDRDEDAFLLLRE